MIPLQFPEIPTLPQLLPPPPPHIAECAIDIGDSDTDSEYIPAVAADTELGESGAKPMRTELGSPKSPPLPSAVAPAAAVVDPPAVAGISEPQRPGMRCVAGVAIPEDEDVYAGEESASREP